MTFLICDAKFLLTANIPKSLAKIGCFAPKFHNTPVQFRQGSCRTRHSVQCAISTFKLNMYFGWARGPSVRIPCTAACTIHRDSAALHLCQSWQPFSYPNSCIRPPRHVVDISYKVLKPNKCVLFLSSTYPKWFDLKINRNFKMTSICSLGEHIFHLIMLSCSAIFNHYFRLWTTRRQVLFILNYHTPTTVSSE